jgi:hypothetical protein
VSGSTRHNGEIKHQQRVRPTERTTGPSLSPAQKKEKKRKKWARREEQQRGRQQALAVAEKPEAEAHIGDSQPGRPDCRFCGMKANRRDNGCYRGFTSGTEECLRAREALERARR